MIVEYARCPLKAHGNSSHLTISINKVSIERKAYRLQWRETLLTPITLLYNRAGSELGMDAKRGFTHYVRSRIREEVFNAIGWPVWLGGILLGVVNVLSLAWALKPFTIFTGYLNWGQHIYGLVGLSGFVGLPKSNPLFEMTSVGDIGLLVGAFTVAILSHEFRIRKPQRSIEYLEAVLGGILMSSGVVLAIGCNWGGFFSAITVLSLHGFLMLIGLIIGGWLGLLYVKWRAERTLNLIEITSTTTLGTSSKSRSGKNPYSALIITPLIVLTVLVLYYVSTDSYIYMGGLFIGIAVGVILQRSRFCFATAFRDLINGPEVIRSLRLQKGIILGLLIGVTGSFILKYKGYIDPLLYVNPSSFSNIIGGILFGLGMVIAGGCASGTLWRAAEGHVKSWIALITMVISYPVFMSLIKSYASWIYGPKIFIPYVLDWGLGLVTIYVMIFAYLTFIMYLEYRFHRG